MAGTQNLCCIMWFGHMKPVIRTNLADGTVDILRSEVRAGRWSLGERIPNEKNLGELLRVSRGTVREAVRVLVSQGLLETRQGSGTYVRSATASEEWVARVRRTGLRDLWETRLALDVEAARLAALRHTAADLGRMSELLAAGESTINGGTEVFSRRDIAFHRSIVEASGNHVLVELYDFFTSAILETIQSTLQGDILETDEHAHAAILDAISTGRPELAAAAARGLGLPILDEWERLTIHPPIGLGR